MATVFKYCDARGLKILTDLEVKVTPPNEFNDPFEFMANIACSNPFKWAYGYFNEDRIRELHTSLLLEGRRSDSFPKFLKEFKANRREFINGWIPRVWPTAIQETQKTVLDDISECLGVLCLSRNETSLLMWGHYCDSHRGMVIGFDDSNEIFKSEWGLRRVNYEEKRVEFDIGAVRSPEETRALNERIIFTKNREWGYEEEVRQIFRLRDLRKDKLCNDKEGYFLEMPPEAIVCVYLGMRCSPELEGKVQSALRDRRLSHVKLNRAAMDDNNFALKFK
jgi:hypothetical protein